MKQIKLLTLFAAMFCAASMKAQIDAPLTFEAMVDDAEVTYSLNETAPVQFSTDGSTWTDYSDVSSFNYIPHTGLLPVEDIRSDSRKIIREKNACGRIGHFDELLGTKMG